MEFLEPSVLRFGLFELDTRSSELRKAGVLVRLQAQPLKVLALLAQRPGELVTREEIQQRIWGGDTFVDFNRGLNFCIKQIRAVLDDAADHPRYIETLPKRGYRFIAPVEPGGQTTRRPEKVMLAVLPFENLSGGPEQEYFVDGVTEEMITQLGRLYSKELGVIARTTAMHYKDTEKRIDQIGQELGVDYILEGSVRHSAERMRITAQLVEVNDQTHLWAETYERDLGDMLKIQGDVAERIAQSLAFELLPTRQAALTLASTKNSAAYEAYLRGRYFWNKRTEESFYKAMRYFQEAIKKDPSFAPAYAGLADCYDALNLYGAFPPKEGYEGARAAALQALEIDNQAVEPHTSLAYAKVLYEWDWSAAERDYKRALELNPNYVTGHHWYALFLAPMGRFEEAFQEMRKALKLDPLSLVLNSHVGWILYFARQYDPAIDQLNKTLEMDPHFPITSYFLGLVHMQKGMYEQAVAELETAKKLTGSHPGVVGALAHVHAMAGARAQAQEFLDQLKQLAKRRYVSPYYLALAYVGLGDRDQALACMERAYEERSGWLVHIKVEPGLDSLRSDPRFQDLLRRMNFPK